MFALLFGGRLGEPVQKSVDDGAHFEQIANQAKIFEAVCSCGQHGRRLGVQAAIPVRPSRGNQRAAPVGQNHKKLRNTPSCEASDDKEPAPFKYMPFTSDDDRIRIVLVMGSLSYLRSTRFRTRTSLNRQAQRIVDRHVLRLIKLWLQAPVEERDDDGKRRMSGGKDSKCGTPQGGVASPLLANIYMNRFLKHWRLTGRGEALRAHVISYADDFVILSRGHAEEALAWTRVVMTKLGLSLNEAKTSVKNARHESFDFLGYTLGPRHFPVGGRWYLGAGPSKKSVQRLKTKVSDLLRPGNKGAWPQQF